MEENQILDETPEKTKKKGRKRCESLTNIEQMWKKKGKLEKSKKREEKNIYVE